MREEHFGGLGWMTSKTVYKRHIAPYFAQGPDSHMNYEFRKGWDRVFSFLIAHGQPEYVRTKFEH